MTITAASEVREASTPSVFNDFSRHPPTQSFLTIDGLLRSHASDSNPKPLICYPKNGVTDFEEHTASAIDGYTDHACQFYLRNGLQSVDTSLEKAPVVAVLATSSFDVIVTMFALNRLGYATLFLSTRLTAPSYARLLEMADCTTIIVPNDRISMVDQISQDRPGCRSVPLLHRTDYRGSVEVEPFHREGIDIKKESNKLAWILHSSGSTGFPKPIYLTNMQCLANFRKSFALRAFCTSPLFHSHGLMELFRAFYTKSTMYLGNYALPVTTQNLITAMRVARPELMCAVPYVLKLLAEKPEGLEVLRDTRLVLYAGSSCPDELGNRLVEHGINLVANYGATETGQIMTSFRPPGDKEWQYMRLHRPVADHTLMDEIAPGVFECVGLDGLPSKGPSNSKPPYSDKNPPNSFRTADLFTRHPDPKKSNYYKYLSRLDDRITLVNGEKVLPIPIEGRIRHEGMVREAIVFGFERSVPGVLIFRSNESGLMLSDDEYLEEVWPAVEAANANAETFSRIPKELVVIKGPDVPYPRTDKGTFIRAQVYQTFSDDITAIYDKFESGHSKGGLQLSAEELEKWLLQKFRNDLGVPLPSASTDIFSMGVDSLQTTRIWRAIKSELDLGDHSQALSQNVVFEKGTVATLAEHLHRLRIGDLQDEDDEISLMEAMVDKYSTFVQHSPTSQHRPEQDIVLVTGATGNLGSFVVAELLKRPSVAQVWALVRASGRTEARTRLIDSFSSRQIDLTESDYSKLSVVPSDLSDENLGLDVLTVERLLNSLTCIIHSAWAVNFNLGVRSFEEQHIKGTYNLINFGLRSKLPTPAKLFFCSSVSVASQTPRPARIAEGPIEDFSHAQKTGYGRSKLVTERIVQKAMETTQIHARVLRIGQLSGDQASGVWNDTEAVALMIRSAMTIKALPALDEHPSWLPVDICAQITVELALRTSNDCGKDIDPKLVYHLVNPSIFSWKNDLLPALQQRTKLREFDVVSPLEWIRRLEVSDQDPSRNPSVKLIDFWKGKYDKGTAQLVNSTDESNDMTFETTRTIDDCPVLGDVKDPISTGLVEKYVDSWLNRWRTG